MTAQMDGRRTDGKNNVALAHLYHESGGGGGGHVASLVEFCPVV